MRKTFLVTRESKNWWAVFLAESAEQIEEEYPELRVVEANLPAWLTPEKMRQLVSQAVDIESSETSLFLRQILLERLEPSPWTTSVHGMVQYWKESGGWGLLTSPDVNGVVKVVRAHLRASGLTNLDEGDEVEFEWEACGQILQAIRVRRVSDHETKD